MNILEELTALRREDVKRAARVRDLAAAFRGDGIHVIAELKKASPSKGLIRGNFDAAALARELDAAGAAALSVLAEPHRFLGGEENVRIARANTDLPILFKDFVSTEYQVLRARACGADAMIAIGGGSSMDTAKAIGVIITNPEFADVRSLEGVAPTKNHAVPTIAVPTTAGTAAEVTINYVITDTEKERKFVCVDEHDIPEFAVVDPEMMASMPKGLTAATGMDALTHAIEGYTTKAAWAMTDMFHLEAIRLIARHLRGAVENRPEDREGMALAQYVAGMGFSNVGLGIAHSIAHTLGAHYDTPHGVACAMMLPIVMEYNQACTGEKYREIARAMGVAGVDDMSQEEYRKAAVEAVRQLSLDVGIPTKNDKIREEDLDVLAADAYADACRPGNPRDTSVEDLKALYRRIMV